MLGKLPIRLNNLKTSLRFLHLGLNPIKDSIDMQVKVPRQCPPFAYISLLHKIRETKIALYGEFCSTDFASYVTQCMFVSQYIVIKNEDKIDL